MAKAPSRSRVLVMLAWLALTAWLFRALAGAGLPGAATIAEQQQIEKLLGIEIAPLAQNLDARTVWGTLAAKPVTNRQVGRYLPLLCMELRKYPPELMARLDLRRFVLCRDLRLAAQSRIALPILESHTLYLDVVTGDYSRDYQRIVVHHELMHVIDELDDGKVYEDPSWTALNAPEFRYGNGGASAQDDPHASLHTGQFPGFLTSYSTTGIEEDKAELFARLMVEPDYVASRIAKDEILRAKVARLKQLLASFCPKFDERAWPAAAPHTVK